MSNKRDDNTEKLLPETETTESSESAEAAEVVKADAEISNGKDKIKYDESLFEGSTVFGASKAVPVKERKLKAKTKAIIFSVASLVVAGAILVGILISPPSDDKDDDITTSTPAYAVAKISEADVESLDVFNKYGKMHIYIPESKKSEAASSKATSSDNTVQAVEEYDWCVEGYEKYNLTGAMYLLKAAINMSATKQLTTADGAQLADDLYTKFDTLSYHDGANGTGDNPYGFDNPYVAFTVNSSKKDKSYSVIIGNTTPDKIGRYVTVTGDSAVYILTDMGTGKYNFISSPADLINYNMVETIKSNENNADYFIDGEVALIDSLTLSGSCRENTLVVESAPDELSVMTFVVSKPTFRAGNENNIADILNIASDGLASEGAFKLDCTSADLAEYGITNPFSKVEIKIADYNLTLSFGKAIDGYYPCYVDGIDIIYKVSVADNEWIAYSSKDIYFDSLFLEFIADISSITVETQKRTVTFNLIRETAEDGEDFDVEVPGYEELEIDATQMGYFYYRILALSVEEYAATECPTDSAYMKFTFDYIDSSKPKDEIALYKYSTRRYFYTLNGKGDALVAAANVRDIYNCLEDLLAGEKISKATY